MPRLRFLAAAAVVAAAAAFPSSALAGKASVSGNVLTYTAAAGEANALTVERLQSSFRVTDAGATVTVGSGCTNAGTRVANCPRGTVNRIDVTLLDRDDSALVTGTTAARLFGGTGSDDLGGGGGADTLDAGPGESQRLRGGAGADKLNAAASALFGDRLSGGAGDDVLTGSTAPASGGVFFGTGYFLSPNVFEGGSGRDLITGTATNDWIDGGTGADDLSGGTGGDDAVSYGGRSEAVTVTLGTLATSNGGGSDGGIVAGKARRDKLTSIEVAIGGAGADRLTGSLVANQLYGGGGGDTLNGGGGDDSICGDGQVLAESGLSASCNADGTTGADALSGGDGADVLDGGPGPDELVGGTGTDAVVYSSRTGDVRATIKDTCGGTACAIANDGEVDHAPTAGTQPEGDRIALDVEDVSGGDGDDVLSGTTGRNRLFGGRGADSLLALDGDDLLCGDAIYASRSQTDTCTGFLIFATAAVGAAAVSESEADTLDAGAGADLLDGGDGPDIMGGGTGTDWVDYSNHSGSVVASIADTCPGNPQPCAQANDGRRDADPGTPDDQSEGDKIGLDVENIAGTSSSDELLGSAAANQLYGGDAADYVGGRGGDDLLEPGAGNGDVVAGGPGRDFAGFRPSRFERFGCSFCLGVGVTVSLDGAANDTVTGQGETDNVMADVEGILGSDYADTLTGRTGVFADTLNGYGGGDTLDGNAGDDSLTGGTGPDTVRGEDGTDVLSVGDGEQDSADCGGGTIDRVVRDAVDTTAGCETVQTVAAPAAAAAAAR